MIQVECIQVIGFVAILIIGLVIMYTEWYLEKQVIDYCRASTRPSWIVKQFKARPLTVIWSLPALFFVGAFIPWFALKGFSSLLSWETLWYLCVFIFITAIKQNNLQHCFQQQEQEITIENNDKL